MPGQGAQISLRIIWNITIGGYFFMKNRTMISVLCICMLLTAPGCGAVAEGEVPSDDNREPAAITVSEQGGQTQSDDEYESIAENEEESGNYASGSAMTASEYGTDAESEMPSDDNREPAAVTESERGEQTDPRDYYEELIAAATKCIEGKDEGETEDDEDYDFSYIIYRYGAYYGASMRLGYLIEDIDGNGTEELIFGENAKPNSTGNSVIYDLYTISDGELIHVFSGGERNRYYFCENGLIANEGANSAYESIDAYYSFKGTELDLVEAVIYNGGKDRENPWFYSTQSDNIYDTDNMEPIGEDQAWAIREKYVYGNPIFTLFVEE